MKPCRRLPLPCLFVVPVALVLSSCLGGVGFDIQRSIDEQTVPGDPTSHALAQAVPGFSPINPFTLNIDLSTEAAAHDTSVVNHVYLTDLRFAITATAEPAGDTDCFDFVNSVTVTVQSSRSGSALPARTVATGASPGCVQTFVLQTDPSVDLKPYIDEGLAITTTGSGVPPADDVSFNGSATLHAAL